jgi:hypothetical protein
MTDKVQKIREEVEIVVNRSLIALSRWRIAKDTLPQ